MVCGGRLRFAGKATQATSGVDNLSRIAIITGPSPLVAPKFLFFNGYGYQGAAANPSGSPPTFAEMVSAVGVAGNNITIEGATLEGPGPVFYTLTFGGQSSIVLTPGLFVWCDPVLAATILANMGSGNWYIRVDISVPSTSSYFPTYYNTNNVTGEGVSISSSSQVAKLTSGNISGSGSNVFGPIAAAGLGWNGSAVPLGKGDSIGYGKGDNWDPSRGVSGFLARGFDDNISSSRMAYLMWCVPSQSQGTTSEGSTAPGYYGYRYAMLLACNPDGAPPITCVAYEHGTNGASSVATSNPADWELTTTALGVPIIQCTLTPHTNTTYVGGSTSTGSGDSNCAAAPSGGSTSDMCWTNSAQQVAQQSAYVYPTGAVPVFNAALKAGSYTGTASNQVQGIIDDTAYCWDPTTGGWLVPGFTSFLTAAANIGDGSVQLNDNPPIGTCLVLSPGSAALNAEAGTTDGGGLAVKSVTGSPGAWIAVLTENLVHAHAINSVVGSALTDSGLHPNQQGSVAKSNGVMVAKNNGTIH